MNLMPPPVRRCLSALLLGMGLLPGAQGAVTDLASSPLQTSAATLVKPNIFYVLDNSGSMVWDFMPDWVSSYGESDWLARNPAFNGVYYDPAITYAPPMRYDGSSYNSMTSANTSGWRTVPYDGFGVMSTGNRPTNTGINNFFTGSGAGTSQDLTGTAYPATFYTFVAGEYCSGDNLRNCNTQSAPSPAFPVPAYLRWCTNASLTNCQATRIDTNSGAPTSYTFARYPGMPSTATVTITSAGLLPAINGITVNGVQILSGGISALLSTTAQLAASVVTNINNCTDGATGNCQASGYSATREGSVVTITSPGGTSVAGTTPVVSRNASVGATASAFAGGTPGGYIQTTIRPGQASYPYPGTSARATTRTDCTSNTTTCTYAEEMTNFANWWAYYRTRMQAMKSATSIAFATLSASYRLGFMSINNNASTTNFLNVADNTTNANGQKQAWYNRLTTALPSGGTALRTSLSVAGRYYAGRMSTINDVSAVDPMQYACQRNYTLLSTDGYWNETTAPTRVDGSTAIGDADNAEQRPYLDGNSIANTLADVAQYFYVTDIRSSALGNASNASGTDVSSNAYSNQRQNMVTSTIGLGASGLMQYDPDYANASSGDYFDVANGTATSNATQSAGICSWQRSGACNWPAPVSGTQTTIDDLWHAAVNGRGAYYSATNAADIKAGLTNFLNTVDATTSAAAAVAQSTPVLTTTTQGYTFSTTFCSGKWYGELARYRVNAATGVTATTPDWAQSGAGADCESTSGALVTTPLLDARNWSTRTIFTYDSSNRARVNFSWDALTPTMQNYFRVAAIGSLSQLCSAGTNCLGAAAQVNSSTAGSTNGAGGANLVNYLRGDRSNEGSTNQRYYRSRTHVLGDIVNSAPVYIQAPMREYTDTGYAAFKSGNAARQGMVYVGANDGMLHAFNADTGAEAWAYVPSVLLPSLYQLADKNYGANHRYFVDGQITQGDVRSANGWRTILVGGLGGGGRAYYALDVTDPAAPSVLWEFSASSTLTPNLFDTDLGLSYGAPVITKLADGTWVAIVSSGYNNVSPGDGRGKIWVLNAMTGAVIRKIDNGMGSTVGGATVPGCAVAPCPSGLARISGWTDAVTDNTTRQIYGGDLYGNLWRFDISNLSSTGGTAPVQLLATLADGNGNRQPVTTTPELGLVSGKQVVFIGTGAYLGVTDVTTTQGQTMYAIKDPLTTSAGGAIYSNPRANRCATNTATNCFVAITLTDASNTSGTRTAASTVTPALNTQNGWYADLPRAGERVDVDPVLFSGTLVYTSNTPSSSGACTTGGSSVINYVNFATGLAVPGVSNVGAVLTANGLSSAPVISVTSSGKVVATTKSSSGATTTTEIPVATSPTGTRRVSWRRLQN